MRRAHLFVLAGLIFFIPLVASAVWTPGQPLVPTEVLQFVDGKNPSPQSVTMCNLFQLGDNLLTFSVYLATLAASIMFAYAGILYVTAASNQENITKAKGIFGKVLVGFLFVLTAWLIVNVIMAVLLPEKSAPWNGVNCDRNPNANPSSVEQSLSVNTGKLSTATTTPEELAAEKIARSGSCLNTSSAGPLEKEHGDPTCLIKFNKDTTCGEKQSYKNVSGGCTNWRGVQPETKSYAESIANECACTLVITGGSEKGHEGGVGSHENGWKFDARIDQGVSTFVEENPDRFKRLDNNSKGETRYQDKETKAIWTKEQGKEPHWDVCVRKEGCGG